MTARSTNVPLLALAGGVGLAGALAGVLAGAPAAADQDREVTTARAVAGPVVTTDAAGDVDSGVDLLKSRLGNGRMVRIALTHADLVPHPEYGVGASIFLDTDPAKKGPEFEFVGGLFQGTDYVLAETDGWKRGKNLDMQKCFYVMNLDYDAERTVVRIDPDCFGDPEKVRIAVKATGDSAEGSEHDWLGGRRQFTKWAASTR